jgi:regulatory protein
VSVPSVEGERDATIIAFPLQRVTPGAEKHTHNAVVIPLTDIDSHDQPPAAEPATPRELRRAHNVAVHSLAGSGKSREEIHRRLIGRDLPEDAVSAEIERLEDLGLVNDNSLASDLVDRYVVRQGLGRQAVAHKMRERHIAPEVIARALEGVSDDDERARLLEVARDRARALSSLAPDVAKRRLVAYLQRRGYRGSDIFSVVDAVLNDS